MSGNFFILGIILLVGGLKAMKETFTSKSDVENAFYDLYQQDNISWDLQDGRDWAIETEYFMAVCPIFYNLISSRENPPVNARVNCTSRPHPLGSQPRIRVKFFFNQNLVRQPPIETDLVYCKCETQAPEDRKSFFFEHTFHVAKKRGSDNYFQIEQTNYNEQYKIDRYLQDTSDDIKEARSSIFSLDIKDVIVH